MHGLFLTTRSLSRINEHETGIYNKIVSQYKELSNYFDVDLLSFSGAKERVSAWLSFVPGLLINFGWDLSKINNKQIDFIYLRFEAGNYRTIKQISKIKTNNPGCKIIVEFPCYPFEWDQYGKLGKMRRPNHDLCVRALVDIADKSVAYGDHKDAYGIPTIIVQNGIDINTITERDITTSDTIRLVSVSTMMPWHAIERLVTSLGTYYRDGGKRKFVFNIVGKGPQYGLIEQLIDDYNLNSIVMLHGYKTGMELDAILNNSDIAIDGLTTSPKQNSSLKSREYMAKGLPIVTSNSYSKETEIISRYIFRVPADQSLIDIDSIIDFYDSVYGKDISYAKSCCGCIRKFAEDYYSIEATMKPIVDYIKK